MFEGSEKKLEVIVHGFAGDLRSSVGPSWDDVVKACRAEILQEFSSKHLDCYLLSESSLFVYKDRLVMITCGQTRLCAALPLILEKIGKNAQFTLFYSRRNFFFPKAQPSDFEQEVALITPYVSGQSYRIGPANGEHMHAFVGQSQAASSSEPDVTFEVLMSRCSPKAMEPYRLNNSAKGLAAKLCQKVGFPLEEGQVQEHFFDPCGYSMNALAADKYLTIHVSPEEGASYVSLETNLILNDYSFMLSKALELFEPEQFMFGLFDCEDRQAMRWDSQQYRKICAATNEFCIDNYRLQFEHYEKEKPHG